MPLTKEQIAWGLLRISLGLTFFWAFIDKLFGLGFATKQANAWLAGGSPTAGFLTNATKGPFKEIFAGLSGQAWVDWLFMIGLLCIGVSLIIGVGMKVAAWTGSLLMLLMYLALMPPANHPFIDDHIIYAIALMALMFSGANKHLGLGEQWTNCPLVKKFPLLE
ncbi:MAG TPA: hypothetical protein VJB90_04540 [Candidatus Nanoarchaeia archaeon]|nr:hypothetical protein [Candidatus Nanoarchaeia archaeon]